MLDYFKAWFRIIAFLFFDVLVGEPVACMFPVSFPWLGRITEIEFKNFFDRR